MKTLKTGDTVYVVGRNGGSVYHVHSIGRKLAKIRRQPDKDWSEQLMELDTWRIRDERKGFGYTAQVYQSKAEYLDKVELQRVWENFVACLSRYDPPNGVTVERIAQLCEEFNL